MGAVLMQRQVLPLHGSAVAIDGKAYAFVGESGAGKSTLAAAFLNRGYPLLSDDVIAVSLSSNGMPIVTPSYPQQKLWQESIEDLGLGAIRFAPLFQRINKYAVPVVNQFCREPIPLGGVFELIATENEMNIQRLEGLGRLPVFRLHTYRNVFVPILNLEPWHFFITTSIVSKIKVFQIRRPSTSFTAQELTTKIIEVINKGE